MDHYGRKVRTFYANMLRHGIVIQPNGAGLDVNLARPDIKLSPLLQDEIRKRARLLWEMLTPVPPSELVCYFYRLLTEQEANQAIQQAERLGVKLDCTLTGGRWLLEICK